MILAAVDIGTNSVKYLLAQADGEKGATVLKDAVKITKLGVGLRKSGLISLPALQRTTDAVKEFVADASHELRTPMTVLTMAAEALSTDKESKYSDFAMRVVKDIKFETKKMKFFLN